MLDKIKEKLVGIPIDAIRESIERGAILLDVRREDEYEAGHVPGSVNIPISELATQLKLLDEVEATEIVVYCASGVRSAVAKPLLESKGFEVINARRWEAVNLIVSQMQKEI